MAPWRFTILLHGGGGVEQPFYILSQALPAVFIKTNERLKNKTRLLFQDSKKSILGK